MQVRYDLPRISSYKDGLYEQMLGSTSLSESLNKIEYILYYVCQNFIWESKVCDRFQDLSYVLKNNIEVDTNKMRNVLDYLTTLEINYENFKTDVNGIWTGGDQGD